MHFIKRSQIIFIGDFVSGFCSTILYFKQTLMTIKKRLKNTLYASNLLVINLESIRIFSRFFASKFKGVGQETDLERNDHCCKAKNHTLKKKKEIGYNVKVLQQIVAAGLAMPSAAVAN